MRRPGSEDPLRGQWKFSSKLNEYIADKLYKYPLLDSIGEEKRSHGVVSFPIFFYFLPKRFLSLKIGFQTFLHFHKF